MNTAKRKFDFQKLLAPIALVILFIFFSFASKTFFSQGTMVSILDSTYYVGLLAFGITFIIITGGIDLSIGTNMMMSALIGGYLFYNGLNIWLCLVLVVLIETAEVFIHGTPIPPPRLPPFLATLRMTMMTHGLGSIITHVPT